jgi:hypothetical protein
MLHRLLADYLASVEVALLSLEKVYIERYVEEILTDTRINLRIRIRWNSGYLLEINEAVIIVDNSFLILDYRYDNTPHFPDLVSFPHHKHLPRDVIACKKPGISDVLQEVIDFS